MADEFPKVLVLDNVQNMVTSHFDIDAKEMIKNGGSRYSIVPFAASSVPAGQRATVQGNVLAHHIAATAGTPVR